MKKVAFFAIGLALLGGIVLGCSGKRTTGPTLGVASPSAYGSVPADRIITVSDNDGLVLKANAHYFRGGDGVLRASVTIGKLTVIYVCDYPMGYYGPPPPGHCWEDGSGCTSL